MFARLFALPSCLFICLLLLLPMATVQAFGLPGLLNGSAKTQPQAEVLATPRMSVQVTTTGGGPQKE